MCSPASHNNDVDRYDHQSACFFCKPLLCLAFGFCFICAQRLLCPEPIIHNPSWAATHTTPDGAIVLFNNDSYPVRFSMTVPPPLASKLSMQFAQLTGQEVGAPTLLFALHYRGCSRMMAPNDSGLPSAMGWGLVGATIPH